MAASRFNTQAIKNRVDLPLTLETRPGPNHKRFRAVITSSLRSRPEQRQPPEQQRQQPEQRRRQPERPEQQRQEQRRQPERPERLPSNHKQQERAPAQRRRERVSRSSVDTPNSRNGE